MEPLESQDSFLRYRIIIDPARRQVLEEDGSLGYWEACARSVEKLGYEWKDPDIAAAFDMLLRVEHYCPNPTLRWWINRGIQQGNATKFEQEFLKRMDRLREDWCQANGKDPNDWIPSILDNSARTIGDILKVTRVK